ANMENRIEMDMERMFALERVVREVGSRILSYKGPIQDTKHVRGHEESNIDVLAYEWMIGSLEKNLDKDLFMGKFLFELRELEDVIGGEHDSDRPVSRKVLRIDEIDGTTNAKRTLASTFDYAPNSTVSVALCDNESLGSTSIGVVYDMHNNSVFSGLRVDGGYLSFCDRRLLDPKDFRTKRGDTSTRIMVVGYSNKERAKKAEIEKAILDADATGKDFRIYDGSRSTTVDVLNIIRNQFDAYVDPRALWPKSGAQLQPYDISGIIPIAYGCGLELCDIHGKPIGHQEDANGPVTLIVARRGLGNILVNAISEYVKESK
ncbi:MAG: hypothetical protein KKE20_02875, partial [Nanoarchaeota archaeon]|nr:hypothetical protein [Nanoarchaeota archaeon]